MVREFLHISIPVMLSDSLLGIGESMLAVIMGHIGSQFVAANAISCIVVFRSANTILTKGVLQGGDTKFLVAADTSMMWFVAIPLGAAVGLWLNISPFWLCICLYSDQVLKAIWCWFRLRCGK